MRADEHPVFVPPAAETRIWRYMDFTKFVDMLERQALYFSRADLLGDPFEGSVPLATVEARKLFPYPEMAEKMAQGNLMWRSLMYVNCWHMSEHESAAMWKLYTCTNEAIAIESTYAALRSCLPGEQTVAPCVYIGMVRYVDYKTEVIPQNNIFWPIIHKRLSFRHEQELRAVVERKPFVEKNGRHVFDPEQPPGKAMPVDVSCLVRNVYVAPTSPPWFYELVSSIVKRYGLDRPVLQSELDASPTY